MNASTSAATLHQLPHARCSCVKYMQQLLPDESHTPITVFLLEINNTKLNVVMREGVYVLELPATGYMCSRPLRV